MAVNEISTAMLAEFEQELATTRRFLERVPEDKLAWRPHEKSMTAGQLALHMAQVPEGVLRFAVQDVAEAPDFNAGRPGPESLREVLDTLEAGAAFVREQLPAIDDARMRATFRVTQGGQQIMSLPRMAFLRSVLLNHWYHHRGQLGVYLRLLGVSVPSSYGPSADEMPKFS
ncbi:MAG: DinB family protein [Pirellulales bacterium]